MAVVGSLVPYIPGIISNLTPGIVSSGVASASELGGYIGGAYRGYKRVKEIYDSYPPSKKPKVMARMRRTGGWTFRKRAKRFRRRLRRVRRYKRKGRAEPRPTTRYQSYSSATLRSKRTKYNGVIRSFDKIKALATPTAKILLQANIEISSNANECAWGAYAACTSYGCTENMGQDLGRQYGAHSSSTSRAVLDSANSMMYIGGVHINFLVRESVSVVNHVKLYTLKCIRSHKADDFGTNATWAGYMSFALGGNSDTFTTGTALASTMVGMTPLSFPGIGRFWKVVKEEDFYLESSHSVEINKGLKINKFFTGKDLDNYDYFKNASYLFVFKVVGDADSTTPFNATAGKVAICANKTVYSKFDNGVNTDRAYEAYGGTVPS